MRLAKPFVDVGLTALDLPPMLRFWQEEAGARFDQVLTIRRGLEQHRHDLLGSVLKINHAAQPPGASAPCGYRELLIAGTGLAEPRRLTDPQGSAVCLVPPGAQDVTQIGVRVAARDPAAQRAFYVEALGLEEIADSDGLAFRAGQSVILVHHDPAAPQDAPFEGTGFRYITLQVFAVDSDHAKALAHGARQAMGPTTLGQTARISMILDPAGNWIELSQRASLTGSLEPR